ncbi:MAG: ATP-binding domain-containing protein [Actinomycetota bacterium]|nr:ATP-binding domain-containing protein [Actinomycetota bacterium]
MSTLAGKVAYEIVALRSATGHQSTHWQLARLLEVDEAAVTSTEQLADALGANADSGLRVLAPLCAIDAPADFIATLARIEMPSETGDQWLASWDADCRLLIDAWQSFVQQADVVEQTWGNFRLHVSRQQRGDDLAPGVRLLTIHKAQGREYRAVAVLGLNDGQLPDFRATSEEDQLAELRTFYVAVTRAARVLLVTRAKSRDTRYGARASNRSPYLGFLQSTQ